MKEILIFSRLRMKYLDTKKSTKKSLIDELSNKLLGLEFKSNNSIKTKCLKYVVKKILPTV